METQPTVVQSEPHETTRASRAPAAAIGSRAGAPTQRQPATAGEPLTAWLLRVAFCATVDAALFATVAAMRKLGQR